MENNTLARSLHDLGAAAWFGGSLMGAVGLNGASAEVTDDKERLAVADAGWARWAPVNAAAIGAHLVGGALLVAGNRARVAGQKGVGTTSAIKTALTLGAMGVTAYAGIAGKKLKNVGRVPVTSATHPSDETPEEVAQWQRQQKLLQWVIPAMTGTIIVVGALMGEQQRPKNVALGVVERAERWLPDALHLS